MADQHSCSVGTAQPREGPYYSLSSREPEFRLLVLKAGNPGDQIRCELHQKPLSQASILKYESVSYSWGDMTPLSTVEVNGYNVNVPKNAEDALHRFRFGNGARTLWIDSICINQSDIMERNSQVALMHKIYQSADRNLIYLGPDDGTVGEALEAVAALVEEIRRETNNYADFFEMIYPKTKRRGGMGTASSSVGFSFDPGPLLRLFARTWFRRVWIVQEASLAGSNLCHCGSHEFRLLDILRVAKWLRFKREHLPFNPYDHPSIVSVALLDDFADREFGWFPLRPWSLHGESLLLALLSGMRYFDAHDQRDHLFGLLGLYQKYSGDSDIPPLLRPDYNKPPAEVLRDATRFVITKGRELSALGYVCHRIDKQTLPLPSWVPRWHEPFNHALDSTMMFQDANAHGGTTAVGFDTNLADPDVLSVRGFLIDNPTGAIVRTLSEICIDNAAFDRLLTLVIEMEASETQTRGEGPCLNGPAATLVTVRDVQAGEPMNQYVQSFKALIAYRETTGKPYPTVSSSSDTVDREVDETLRQQAVRFANEAKLICHRRRLFITSSGRLGLGPQTMQDGDVAAILYGGRWPFILRRHGKEYEFVGDSYVYGLMQGDAIVRHRQNDTEDEIFCIR